MNKAISRVTQRKMVDPDTMFLNTPYNAYSKTNYTIARFGVIRQDDDEAQTGAVAKWMK